jgi:hypothetical protein
MGQREIILSYESGTRSGVICRWQACGETACCCEAAAARRETAGDAKKDHPVPLAAKQPVPL